MIAETNDDQSGVRCVRAKRLQRAALTSEL
jgi:hypothetical protein